MMIGSVSGNADEIKSDNIAIGVGMLDVNLCLQMEMGSDNTDYRWWEANMCNSNA
jgi:hypothetical protein